MDIFATFNHRKSKSDLSPLSRCVSRSVKTRKRYEGIVSDAKQREREKEKSGSEMSASRWYLKINRSAGCYGYR